MSYTKTQLRQTFRSLHLRTSPNADVAATTVTLQRADEVVMDNGESVLDWDDLSAIITTAGAGGLDTGAEAASTRYEIWAIRKSSDGTKNLLLHRAKNFSADTSFTTATDAQRALRLSTGTATDKLAQGIQFSNSDVFHYIDVKLIRAGAVSGRVWFSIQASSGGDADAVALATTDKIDAAVISTSEENIRIIFRVPTTPSAATQYHLVLEGDYTKSDTVYIAWRGVAAGGYGSGVAREYNGTTWANASGVGDFNFQAYITRNDAAVTMPSGYDQKCKIGYVYNDSGSNFDPFVASDRFVQAYEIQATATITATVPTLIDISAFIPPGALEVEVAFWNGTSSAFSAVAGVPNGYDASAGSGSDPSAAGYVINRTPAAVNAVWTYASLITEFQGLYGSVGSGTMNLQVTGYRW